LALAGVGDTDALCVLEGIIEVKLPSPFSNLQGKPQTNGSHDGDTYTSFPLGGINLGDVGLVRDLWFGFLVERCCF
jgi:hypothetical protein